MQKESAVFRVNSPDVVHEVIDGEAVIVNMKNGDYYSVDSAGAVIWSLIDEGRTVGEILGEISEKYTGELVELEAGVMELIDRLHEEKLILPVGNGQSVNSSPQNEAVKEGGGNVPFVKPILEKYTDMEELLLLDPVNAEEDVEDTEDLASQSG